MNKTENKITRLYLEGYKFMIEERSSDFSCRMLELKKQYFNEQGYHFEYAIIGVEVATSAAEALGKCIMHYDTRMDND